MAGTTLREGDAVLLSKGIGFVRFIGSGDMAGRWGMELVTPDGDTDGSYEGTSYFSCKPEYGVFVTEKSIKRQITPQELLNKIGLLNKKMKTLKSTSDPSQNPQIQMQMQDLREGIETANRQKKKTHYKLVEIAKDYKAAKREIEDLKKRNEHLQQAVDSAQDFAQAAMAEKGQFVQQAMAYKQRLADIERAMADRARERAEESDEESDITIESALEDEVGTHIRITTEDQLREEQEFTVKITERPTGIRFGHEDEGQTLVVHSVTRGKLGERVGIRPGDIVLGINNESITESETALQLYRTVDLPLELSILRTQTQVANEFEVTIEQRPAGLRFKHEDNGGTLVVNEVVADGHGCELGIQPGDIIVMVQQENVPDSETMLALYREASCPFTLRLYRNKSSTSFLMPILKEDLQDFVAGLQYDSVSFPSFVESIREFLQPGDEIVRVGKHSLYGRSENEVIEYVDKAKPDEEGKVLVQFQRSIRSFVCDEDLTVNRAFDPDTRVLADLNSNTVINISEIREGRGKMVYPLVGWVDVEDENGENILRDFSAGNPADALGTFARRELGISLSSEAVDDIMHFAALHPHQDFVCSVQWSPVEDVCASGASDNTMRLWRVRKNRGIASLSCYAEFQCKECVYCIAFSPNGEYLAAALYDNTVEVREVSTGRLEAVLGEHDYFVWQVRFTPDGNTLVSSAGKYVYIWQTQPKWKLVARLQADGGGVWGVGLSPDGRFVATSGNDNTVKIWKLDTCDFVASLIGHTRRPMCVVFTYDGRFLISGGDDRQIRIWGVQDGKCRAVLAGHQDNVRALSVTHDGLLASASDDNTIKLWNLQTGHCIRTMIGHQDAVRDVAFNRTGQYLCSGSNDNTMRVWTV